MATVIGPFLSLGARKTLGNTLTASNWKGINTMRLKPRPSNPKTQNQMAARAFFAVGGKISKRADLTGDVVSFIKEKTPAQMAWNGYFGREINGTGNVNIEAAKAAYNLAGNATVKGYFDDAAEQAGIESIDLDGTANTQVPAGLILWAAYAASNRMSDPSAPAVVTSATEPQVFAYTDALTGVLPT